MEDLNAVVISSHSHSAWIEDHIEAELYQVHIVLLMPLARFLRPVKENCPQPADDWDGCPCHHRSRSQKRGPYHSTWLATSMQKSSNFENTPKTILRTRVVLGLRRSGFVGFVAGWCRQNSTSMTMSIHEA